MCGKFHTLLLRVQIWVPLKFDFSLETLSLLTIFFVPQYSQEEDLNNGTISSQIGPRVPSGLILKDITFFAKNCCCFFVHALLCCFLILVLPRRTSYSTTIHNLYFNHHFFTLHSIIIFVHCKFSIV